MRRPDATARTVLQAYGEVDRSTRIHTSWRWLTCPFPAIAALLPERGRILDLGCGHGHFAMYLALQAPGRHVVGVDIDGHKIAIGTRVLTRAGLGGRVELIPVGDDWLPEPESFDAVVSNDVLYLMGRPRAAVALAAMAGAVRPGGVVVAKEVGPTPRWKHGVNQLQERLAIGVLRLTAGTTVEVLDVDELEGPLRAAGLAVDVEQMDRGYPHAHVAVIGRRPAA